jgi:pyridoxine 5'-phosphate synthase PdxJ
MLRPAGRAGIVSLSRRTTADQAARAIGAPIVELHTGSYAKRRARSRARNYMVKPQTGLDAS